MRARVFVTLKPSVFDPQGTTVAEALHSLGYGVVFSGTVLLELAKRGVSREQAYEWVQRNAMRSFAEQKDFKALLKADADVAKVLPPAEIERAFDLDEQLKHVDHIFARVFECEPVSSSR